MEQQETPKVAFGKVLPTPETPPFPEEINNLTLQVVLRLLSGREKPVTAKELTCQKNQEGNQALLFPKTDQIVGQKPDKPPEIYPTRIIPILNIPLPTLSKVSPLLPISLAAQFNTTGIFPATEEAINKAKELVSPNRVRRITNASGEIIAIIVPGITRPVVDKEGNLRQFSGSLVLVDENISPSDFPRVVYALTQERTGVPSGFTENLASLFSALEVQLSQYKQIIAGLDASSFDQGFFPGQETLISAKTMVDYLLNYVRKINQTLNPSSPPSSQEELDKFTQFSSSHLAKVLYRLGVKEEKLRELFPQRVVEEIDFKNLIKNLRRVKRPTTAFRYGRFLLNILLSPQSGFLSSVAQIFAEKAPVLQTIEELAKRAAKSLVKNLEVPAAVKEYMAEFKLPPTVEKWLEAKKFKEELDELRRNLTNALLEVSRLSPEQQEQYQRLKQEWEEYLRKNLWQHFENNHQFPNTDFSEIFKDFHPSSSYDKSLLSLLGQEQQARWQLAQKEHQVIEEILKFQGLPKFGFQGYGGWKEEKEKMKPFLESAPSRIIIDKELNCIGRQGLVMAMLEALGFKDQIYTVNTYKHGFLMFEDSFGLSRVVEPSGFIFNSYFPQWKKEKGLYYLSRSLSQRPTLREEMRVGDNLERVNIVKGPLNWQIWVIKNWLIKVPINNQDKVALVNILLTPNPDEESLWDFKSYFLEEDNPQHPQILYAVFKAISLNDWYPTAFARLALPNEILALQLEDIKNRIWDPNLLSPDPQKQREMIAEMIEAANHLIKIITDPKYQEEIKRRAEKSNLKWLNPLTTWQSADFQAAKSRLEELVDYLSKFT